MAVDWTQHQMLELYSLYIYVEGAVKWAVVTNNRTTDILGCWYVASGLTITDAKA